LPDSTQTTTLIGLTKPFSHLTTNAISRNSEQAMSEVLRCSNPECNSLFRVGNDFVQGSVACPTCRQFTEFDKPRVETTAAKGVRRPFDFALAVLLAIAGALSCAAVWLVTYVLLPNELEVIYGVGTALTIQLLLSSALLVGNRLAWKGTIVLGALWVLLNGIAVCGMVVLLIYLTNQQRVDLSNPKIIPVYAALGLEVLRILMWIIILIHLNSAVARQSLGLVCSHCGELEGQAGDLFFRWVRCPRCRSWWTR
jgi:phage FluMu protein Com